MVMRNFREDDLDAKALGRLMTKEQITKVLDLVDRGSAIVFDSVAGEGCWLAEFSEEQRRTICQRIMVRMVDELFNNRECYNLVSPKVH